MIKTTLEWHRTSDQLPDDDALVIAADSDGDTFAAFVDGSAWRYADAIPAPTPEFWAHFPDGPVPELEPLPGEMTDREVMQQALEALETHAKQYPHMVKGYTQDAVAALRARLENDGELFDTVFLSPAALERLGVRAGDLLQVRVGAVLKPLRIATRSPLTDEEIERLWYPSASIAEPGKRRVAFGRAIERAHKIGGNDE